MEELISIIIPVFNAESTLEKCIKSVLEQTYKNLEIILINDGSTDNSKKICQSFQMKYNIIKFFEKENKGVSSARNLGIEKSRGGYITFIDSDDYVSENFIKDLHDAFMLREDIDITHCGTVNVDEDFNTISKSKINEIELFDADTYMKKILEEKKINAVCWGKMYNRKIISKVRFDENIQINEDLDFLLNILLNCRKIVYIPKTDYYWVDRKNSVTKQGFNDKWLKNIENCKTIFHNILNKKPKLKRYCRNKYFKVNLLCYKKMLKDNLVNDKIKKELKENLKKGKFFYFLDYKNSIKNKLLLLYMLFT